MSLLPARVVRAPVAARALGKARVPAPRHAYTYTYTHKSVFSSSAATTGGHSSVYDFDTLFEVNHLALPRLPIPDLDATLERYTASLSPLFNNRREYDASLAAIEAFRKGPGPQLQKELVNTDEGYAKSGTFPYFYFEDEWDLGYLAARCPNPVHINPTFFLNTPKETCPGKELAKAAAFLSASARWLLHARNGSLASDGLDMSRLGRVMGTARLPGENIDTLQFHATSSTHVVVQAGGGDFFRVDIMTPDGTEALSVDEILGSLQEVRSKASTAGPPGGVGLLTSMPRTDWFHAREHLSSVSSTNRESLEQIDSALMMVALDGTKSDDLTERCRSGLHGIDAATRADRWWDKIQLLVDGHGRLGLHFEHSFSDGICWNRWLGEVWHAMGEMETPAKWAYGDVPEATGNGGNGVKVLDFDIDDATRENITRADKLLKVELADRVDTIATSFEGFGKSEIKSLGYSPDAFVQMSFQLAYARMHWGQSAATYEACSTAGAFHGRTETIRSCSAESSALVNACLDERATQAQVRGFVFESCFPRRSEEATDHVCTLV